MCIYCMILFNYLNNIICLFIHSLSLAIHIHTLIQTHIYMYDTGVLRSRGADQPGHYYVVVQGGQKRKKGAASSSEERVSVNILGELDSCSWSESESES